MTLWRLVVREIAVRRTGFALSLSAVAVASGLLAFTIAAVGVHERRTRAVLAAGHDALRQRLAVLDEEIRQSMERIGFSITILPRGQSLEDWHRDDYAAQSMPEDYLDRLEAASPMSVEHFVGRLRRKIKWTEKEWTLIVVGSAAGGASPTTPAANPDPAGVPDGRVALGWEIHRALGYKAGDTLTLNGHSYTVERCLPEQGTKDDITVWMRLADAQALLGQAGVINEILAKECRAAWANPSRVRSEVSRVLPGVTVIEDAPAAHALAAVRRQTEQAGRNALEREAQTQARLARSRLHSALAALAVIAVAGTVWIVLLTIGNVHARRGEIGTLRALGFTDRQMRDLFARRTALLGIAGGTFGFGAAMLAVGWSWEPPGWGDAGTAAAAALLLALGVTSIAGWLPLRQAVALDPAELMREET